MDDIARIDFLREGYAAAGDVRSRTENDSVHPKGIILVTMYMKKSPDTSCEGKCFCTGSNPAGIEH
jgi:hypothetical protein